MTYCASTPGVQAADNATVRLDLDNEPQPDALLRIDPEAIGGSRLSADDYIEGEYRPLTADSAKMIEIYREHGFAAEGLVPLDSNE